MLVSRERQTRGQALVEFALIIGVLLLIIFVVIESAHLLQANLTVQNAARAAGRYAITGQFETDCLLDSPPCDDPRVASIKTIAEEELAGLSLDPNAVFEQAGYYLIEVFGTDAAGNLLPDNAGAPGRPIIVRVSYRAPIWTPLLRPIAETVMVTGQTVMNNEKVVQADTAGDGIVPPVPPPAPTIGPTLSPPPDLVLSKSAPSSVVEGASFQYTLSFVNNGLQAATDVELTDTLMPGLSYVGVNPSTGCSFEGSNSTVTCLWSSIAVGESKNVSIDVTAELDIAPTTITNTATVALAETDGNPADNTASTSTSIVADTSETDLQISKTGPQNAPVSTVDDSFIVDYELTVTNNGPREAVGVVVTDTLPGLTFVGSTGGCSADPPGGSQVICSLGDLPNGGSRTLTIQAQTPSAVGTLTNTARVSATVPGDFDLSNNEADHSTEFVYLADLEITKHGSPSSVYAGQPVTYTIDVWNNVSSPHTATGVDITDPLPNYVQLQSATYTLPDASGGNCAVSGNTVTCPIGTLEPGEHASATIIVVPTRPGTMINSAQVAGNENDPDTINSASAVTMVDAESDLSIVKTAEPDSLFAGELITYTLTVRNDGPSQATGVRVVDQLPSQVIYQFVETDYGSCEWNSILRRITCWLGNVPVGQVITIKIIALPYIPDVEFVNEATVIGNESDPFDNNNSAVTSNVRAGNPFIVVQPSCGRAETATEPGTTIQIDGYLWSDQNNRDVTLSWLEQDGNTTQIAVFTSGNSADIDENGHFTWSGPVLPGIIKEVLRIRAVQSRSPTYTMQFRVPCPAPDLEVTSILPAGVEVEQNEPVTYTVTIENTGDRAANDPFFISLYAFDSPVLAATTHLTETNRLDAAMVSGLDIGESIDLTLRAENGFAIIGTHHVYALVDSDPGPSGEIVEMYETNNLAYTTIEVIEGTTEPPPPEGEQVLSGETYISSGNDEEGGVITLQPLVKIDIFDVAGGALLGTAYSNYPGANYQFTNLPDAAEFYVEASVTVDSTLYVYEGIVSPPSQTLVLRPQ